MTVNICICSTPRRLENGRGL